MTAPIDHDLHYYLGRAEAMRTFAIAITDPTTRMAVLHVADSYKRLAERAERREKIEQELLVVGKTTGRAIEVRDCGA